jgi:dihydroflavonol-4-reductase
VTDIQRDNRLAVVTGAAGHLGNVLVRRLVELGRPVRAVVAPFDDLRAFEDLEVRVAVADVRSPAALARAFAGADTVFHLAGIISIHEGQARLLEAVNVEGTRNVIAACRAAGARRLVYSSSVHALPEPPHGTPVCETGDFDPAVVLGDYARSKARASIEVRRAALEGLDAVMVFPSGIIGPFDYRPSEMGRLFLAFARGRMRAAVEGAYDFVDVRDVAEALVSAADHGRGGEGYLVSGHGVTVRDLFRMLGELTGVRPPRFSVPFALARVGAALSPLWAKLTRTRPLFTPYSLAVLRSNCLMDRSKAERELGFRPRGLRDTVADTLGWFRAAGMLPARG